jgi:hypothetical protein
MTLIDQFIDTWAKRNGLVPSEAVRDAWYATRIGSIERGDGTVGKGALEKLDQVMQSERLQTPEFKKWFGNSTIVNPDGTPMPMYHGSMGSGLPGTNEISVFDPNVGTYKGSYFSSDPSYANQYAQNSQGGASVYQVYIKIEKPFVIDLDTNGTSGAIVIDGKIEGFYRDLSIDAINKLKSLGYDGITAKWKGNDTFEVVTFLPEQIKSVFNQGTWDPNNPNILKQGISPKGSYKLMEDGRAIIRGMQSGDISTMVHEVAHVFRRDLSDADMDVVAQHGGLVNGTELRELEAAFMSGQLKEGTPEYDKYVAAEEQFARGWERYLAEGDAPTPQLKSIFRQFTDWMLNIYKSLRKTMNKLTGVESTPLNVDITAKVNGQSLKDVFDRMLTDKVERIPTLDRLAGERFDKVKREGRNSIRFKDEELSTMAHKELIADILGRYDSEDAARKALTDMQDYEVLKDGTQIDDATINDALKYVVEHPEVNPWIRKEIPQYYGAKTSVRGIADPTKEYPLTFKVIDLDDIQASNVWKGDQLIPNPDYLQELQPRDRATSQSVQQTEKIARTLVPDKLLDKQYMVLDDGAPIVGTDNMVESGNGRVLSLKRAAENYPDKFAEYQDALKSIVQEYGIDPASFADMSKPVLVRESQHANMDERIAFVNDANGPKTLQMSPTEMAVNDAAKISDPMLLKLNVLDNEDLTAALSSERNNKFINAFLEKLNDNERGAITTDGKINLNGVNRIVNALFYRVFPGVEGERLLSLFGSTQGNSIKAAQSAIMASLPQLAVMEGKISNGIKSADLSIANDIIVVADRLAYLKENGLTAGEYLDQMSMFADPKDAMSVPQKQMLRFFDSQKQSAKMRKFIREYAGLVDIEPDAKQVFTEGQFRRTKEELLNDAIERATGQGGLFDFTGDTRTDATVPDQVRSNQLEESDTGTGAEIRGTQPAEQSLPGMGEEVQSVAGAAEAGQPAVKQPWEMTRDEYLNDLGDKRSAAVVDEWADMSPEERLSRPRLNPTTAIDETRKFALQDPLEIEGHKETVKRALSEGKPVPPEVLRDYPDLVAKNVISTETKADYDAGKPVPIEKAEGIDLTHQDTLPVPDEVQRIINTADNLRFAKKKQAKDYLAWVIDGEKDAQPSVAQDVIDYYADRLDFLRDYAAKKASGLSIDTDKFGIYNEHVEGPTNKQLNDAAASHLSDLPTDLLKKIFTKAHEGATQEGTDTSFHMWKPYWRDASNLHVWLRDNMGKDPNITLQSNGYKYSSDAGNIVLETPTKKGESFNIVYNASTERVAKNIVNVAQPGINIQKVYTFKHGDTDIVANVYKNGELIAYMPAVPLKDAQLEDGVRILGLDPQFPDKWVYEQDGVIKSVDSKKPEIEKPQTASTNYNRAPAGGIIGMNGEFYPGGTFLPNTTMPKLTPEQRKTNKFLSAKQEIAPFTWELPPSENVVSIYRILGGALPFDKKTSQFRYDTVSQNTIEYLGGTTRVKELVDAYNKGAKWLDKSVDMRKPEVEKPVEQTAQPTTQLTKKKIDSKWTSYSDESGQNYYEIGYHHVRAGNKIAYNTYSVNYADPSQGGKMVDLGEINNKAFNTRQEAEDFIYQHHNQQNKTIPGTEGQSSLFQSGQLDMFSQTVEDLPLFSGTPMSAEDMGFAPKAASPQMSLFPDVVPEAKPTRIIEIAIKEQGATSYIRLDLKKTKAIRDTLALHEGAEMTARILDANGKVMESNLNPQQVITPTMGGNALFQEAEPTRQWYYSQLGKVLETMPNKMTPDALRGFINGKVKADELQWTGFDKWIAEQQGQVTKQDALDFIMENQVKVEEVVHGGNENVLDENGKPIYDGVGGLVQTKTPTKFDNWQLPGGENYRELLLTLPVDVSQTRNPTFEEYARFYGAELTDVNIRQDYAHDLTLGRWEEKLLKENGIGFESKNFKSPHWSEPNVLAHIRFNDRVDADGKRVLFIEEIQSDWHQAGRENGYGTAKGVPPAPFSKNWEELAVKRAIRYAAENGYDRVAWTTGKMQSDRYQLGNHIDTLEYGHRLDNNRWILRGTKNGETLVSRIVEDGELEGAVGVDVAKKMRNLEGNRGQYNPEIDYRILDKIDLIVESQGMKGFYDQKIPNIIRKYIKKWGAEVGETKVSTGKETFTPSVQSFDVTDSMRESVVYQGQPLFQQGFQEAPGATEQFREYNAPPIDVQREMDAPMGKVPLNGTPTTEPFAQTLNEVTGDYINPILTDIQSAFKAKMNDKAFSWGDVAEADRKTVRQYLNGTVTNDLADVKRAALTYGDTMRNNAMLDYSRRFGFDNYLNLIFPYQFWYTRSMMNWAKRAIDKPSWFAMYARIQQAQERMEREGMPTRLRGKVRFDQPWMPEWMGGGLWTDPLNKLFPFDQFGQPFEQYSSNQNQVMKRAEQIIDDMRTSEKITSDDARQALETQSGSVWDRAVSQAELELDKSASPLSLATMMMTPALWWAVPYNIAKGTPEKISTLPITRTGQTMKELGKDTFIEPLTDLVGGIMAGPETAIRKKAGLSEFGQWGDYYIDRTLAGMAADGEITAEQARIAMIQRSGDAFAEAYRRVQTEQALRTPGAAGLMALKETVKNKEGIGTVAGQTLSGFLVGMFGGSLFSEGELKMRGLKPEYDNAWRKFEAGDEEAINTFFDNHPEYYARLALYDEPETRLHQFLIDSIWKKYMDLDVENRRLAREALGDEFLNSFLNKETRSYDAVSDETLARWSQTLGKSEMPEQVANVQGGQVEYYDQAMVQAITIYKAEKERQFPNIAMWQEQYYALPAGAQRKAFLQQYPQLKAYWDWKDDYAEKHPEIVPYFDELKQSATSDEVTSEMTNPLIRSLLAYATGGSLTSGAKSEIERIRQMYAPDMDEEEFLALLMSLVAP